MSCRRRIAVRLASGIVALALALACGGGGGSGSPAACVDDQGCAPAQACVGAETCDPATHTCLAGERQPDGTDCGGGLVCVRGACLAFDCGSGTLESGEECDDSNGTPRGLDGCDASCRYELFLRVTALSISGSAAPSSCTPATNRLGHQVLTSLARDTLDGAIQDGMDAGELNVLVQLLGLDDLTGVADPDGLEAGFLAAELDPAGGAWTGATLDHWFLADPQALDANDLPLLRLGNGTLTDRKLTLGPGEASLPLALGGAPATMRIRSVRVSARLDGTPAPDVPGPPPALLAPGLRVVQELTASGSGRGICGNVTVESLAQIPVPAPLAAGAGNLCSAACGGSRSYTYCGSGQPVGPGCNSLLDVIVGGCKATSLLGCVALVNAEQPDVPGVEGGTVAPLTLDVGTSKVPAAQTAGNQDGYSLYLQLDATRVHVTGKAP